MKNEGKKFEEDFRKSVPADVYYLRLHDSANSFNGAGEGTRFALKSPYDCILCKDGIMFCMELKSHKGRSLPFTGTSPAIQVRQVDELVRAERHGAVAGLVINFRDYAETWYIPAERVRNLIEVTPRKSVSLDDARRLGMIIPVRKLRVNYRYDIRPILMLAGNGSRGEINRICAG